VDLQRRMPMNTRSDGSSTRGWAARLAAVLMAAATLLAADTAPPEISLPWSGRSSPARCA
jgi:hypothetical protein